MMKFELRAKRAVRRFAALTAMFVTACVAFADDGVSLVIAPGSGWVSKVFMGVVPVKKTPQYAAWIETVDGSYVETLIVTSRASHGDWRGNPKGGRPDALPVWAHATAAVSEKSTIDAASSATPDGDKPVSASTGGLVRGNEYIIRFEINHSFDYNDTWSKSAKKGETYFSGVNGQPSLVYGARFIAGKAASVVLAIEGHGSVDGRDGSIVQGTDGMTSALSIADAVRATVKGE